jgi:hypothetical protein
MKLRRRRNNFRKTEIKVQPHLLDDPHTCGNIKRTKKKKRKGKKLN